MTRLPAFFVVIFSFLIASCRKDEKIGPHDVVNTTPEFVEKPVRAFQSSLLTANMSIANYYGKGNIWNDYMYFYDWEINYMLGQGVELDNKTFYPIMKKWDVTHYRQYTNCEGPETTWVKTLDWFSTGQYYRYNPNSKIATIYDDGPYSMPRIVMDFNHESGDVIELDDYGTLTFAVTEKTEFEWNGISYPILKGDFQITGGTNSCSSCHREPGTFNVIPEAILTPFCPNPLVFGDHFEKIKYHDWSVFAQSDTSIMPVENWFPKWSGNVPYGNNLRLVSQCLDSLGLPENFIANGWD